MEKLSVFYRLFRVNANALSGLSLRKLEMMRDECDAMYRRAPVEQEKQLMWLLRCVYNDLANYKRHKKSGSYLRIVPVFYMGSDDVTYYVTLYGSDSVKLFASDPIRDWDEADYYAESVRFFLDTDSVI